MEAKLTSFDLHQLMDELKILEKSRLDKVFLAEEHMVLSFYVFGQGKKYLHYILPSSLFLSSQKNITSLDSGFCKILRKYLVNKRLVSLNQYGFERIVVLDFETHKLVLEMFDKGNVLLLKEGDVIVSARHFKKFRERTIRGGIKYEFPKGKINPLKMTAEEFSEVLNNQTEQIVKVLAREFSLGGKYAEELCERANIDKKSSDLSKNDQNNLFIQLKKFLSQKRDENLSSKIEKLARDEKPILVQENPNIKKIKTIIQKQKDLLQASIKKQEAYNMIGSKIYENYAEIEKLLNKTKELKKKEGWQAVKENLENEKVKINKNTGKITIEIK